MSAVMFYHYRNLIQNEESDLFLLLSSLGVSFKIGSISKEEFHYLKGMVSKKISKPFREENLDEDECI